MILSIIFGLFVGIIAQALLTGQPRHGWIVTALVGMAGGWIGHILGAILHMGVIGGFVMSIACAMGLFSLMRGTRFV